MLDAPLAGKLQEICYMPSMFVDGPSHSPQNLRGQSLGCEPLSAMENSAELGDDSNSTEKRFELSKWFC